VTAYDESRIYHNTQDFGLQQRRLLQGSVCKHICEVQIVAVNQQEFSLRTVNKDAQI
jgi:hypothetical protein